MLYRNNANGNEESVLSRSISKLSIIFITYLGQRSVQSLGSSCNIRSVFRLLSLLLLLLLLLDVYVIVNLLSLRKTNTTKSIYIMLRYFRLPIASPLYSLERITRDLKVCQRSLGLSSTIKSHLAHFPA